MKVRIDGTKIGQGLKLLPVKHLGRYFMQRVPQFFTIEIDFTTIKPREKHNPGQTGRVKFLGKGKYANR